MPSLVPPAEAPAAVARLRAALDAAHPPEAGRPPPRLLVLRSTVIIDKALLGPNVCSLRIPLSEQALHDALTRHTRERPGAPGAGIACLGSSSGPADDYSTRSRAETESETPSTRAAEAAMAEAERVEPAPPAAGSPAAAPEASPAPAEPKAPAQRQPRILLVEDTPTNARILLMQLAKLGHKGVVHAGDGLEALRAAREAAAGPAPFDVLLSDIMSAPHPAPPADAGRAAPGRVPYAIALSANVGARDRRQCAEAGYDAFLAKPVRVDDLARALAQAAAAVGRRAPPPVGCRSAGRGLERAAIASPARPPPDSIGEREE
eukprot:tig00000017_g11.t1